MLLVHPGGPLWTKRQAGAWSIPKGEIDPGDTDLLAAAEREVAEELGRPAPPGRRLPLGEIVQSGGKRVIAWGLEADLDPADVVSNRFEMEWPPRSGRRQSFPEIDRAQWCSPDQARQLLNPAQLALVDRLLAELDLDRPAPTGGGATG